VTPELVHLRALGWDHPRCLRPMEACAIAWSLRRPDIAISWEARSLADFGDQPLEEVAGRYDLLMIDYPFCGAAEVAGVLRPLDELLTANELIALSVDAIGPSHESYAFDGHQWALAIDAACQVSAVSPSLLGARPAPRTWEEALALARDLAPRVALPLAPAHSISSFLTLCANAGSPPAADPDRLVQRDVGEWAIDTLSEFYSRGPAAATQWEPPDVLGRLTTTDELSYVPLTYGFITYASPSDALFPCRFVDLPSSGYGPVGATLGGAGLAISATSQHPHEAAAFAAWSSSSDVQRTIVARSGGQPGSRSAWTDPALDHDSRGFYSDTITTIENAWVRPRDAWWPPFQLEGGRLLTRIIEDGGDAGRALVQLEALYLNGLRGHG